MGQESACPEASYWKVKKTSVDGDIFVLYLMPVRVGVACPLCRVCSRRIHSRYRRRALDLPWFSWPVQLIIQARRFFCDNPECERRIFVEPFPKALGRYARQIQRTKDSLLELSHCTSAEMAARVARLLGFVTSPDSLLRLQRLERFPAIFPRVLGVDEFALRRGRSYGTLMVDLERRVPVDIFEGIAAKDLTAWPGPSVGGSAGQGPGLGLPVGWAHGLAASSAGGGPVSPGPERQPCPEGLAPLEALAAATVLWRGGVCFPRIPGHTIQKGPLGSGERSQRQRAIVERHSQKVGPEPQDCEHVHGFRPASGICGASPWGFEGQAPFALSKAEMD